MKIIIFGGSGFLGLNVAKLFLKKKFKVIIFDKKKNFFKHRNLKYILGDILNFKNVLQAVGGCKYVYNFAGISDIGQCLKNPIGTVNSNILGTVNTLEASRIHKVKKYIFASSLYSTSGQGGFYSVSKRSCELYINEFKKKFGMRFTIIRYGSIYGVNSDVKNGISKILQTLKKKGRLQYGGTNKAVRRFLHINDASILTLNLLNKKYDNKIVYLFGNKSYKIASIMNYLSKVLKIKKKVLYSNKPELGHYDIKPKKYVDPKKIILFKNKPVDLRDALDKLINHFRLNKN